MRKYLYFLCLLFSISSVQGAELDSLWSEWNDQSKEDSLRLTALKTIIFDYYAYSKPDSAIVLSALIKERAEQISSNHWRAEALNLFGISYYVMGDLAVAMGNFRSALRLHKSTNYLIGQSTVLTNMANIYDDIGKPEKALELYEESLQLEKGNEDKVGLGGIYMNIGVIYFGQGLQEKAKQMYLKSLQLLEEENYERGVAVVLNNLAAVYQMLGVLDTAQELYNKSLSIRRNYNDEYGIARCLDNLSELKRIQGRYDEAEEDIRNSLRIKQDIGYSLGIANSYLDLAQLYLAKTEFQQAKLYADSSWIVASELDYVQVKHDVASVSYRILKELGDFEGSLEMHELSMQLKDSLNSEGLKEKFSKQEARFEFEKSQLLEEQRLQEEKSAERSKRERRNLLQYAVILILLLLAFGFVVSAPRFHLRESQIESLSFLLVLIFLEFLLVFADPYIESWSGGAPGIKLALNAGLALLIIPIHRIIETRLKSRVLKKDS